MLRPPDGGPGVSRVGVIVLVLQFKRIRVELVKCVPYMYILYAIEVG